MLTDFHYSVFLKLNLQSSISNISKEWNNKSRLIVIYLEKFAINKNYLIQIIIATTASCFIYFHIHAYMNTSM
jgi:hypothetical protein